LWSWLDNSQAFTVRWSPLSGGFRGFGGAWRSVL